VIPENGTDQQLKACAEQACLPKRGERWGWQGVDLHSVWTTFNVLEVADGWVYTNSECPDISVGRWYELYAQQRLKRWDYLNHARRPTPFPRYIKAGGDYGP
jgi:hypothetical protein